VHGGIAQESTSSAPSAGSNELRKQRCADIPTIGISQQPTAVCVDRSAEVPLLPSMQNAEHMDFVVQFVNDAEREGREHELAGAFDPAGTPAM
jgi:hypothetical protein